MSYALTNVTIVDAVSRKLRQRATVVLDKNVIRNVIYGEEKGNIIENVTDVMDCKGRFLLPGLMDMHMHLYEGKQSGEFLKKPSEGFIPSVESERKLISKLHSYLYCGVTSIYDAGNFAPTLYFLRHAERTGKIISPRIFCAGWFVTCPRGHGSPLAVEISSLPAEEQKLREHLASKPDMVKITYDERNWATTPLIPILSKGVLKAIINVCHSSNLRVTVHTSNEFRSREAIECGADALARTVIQSPITEEFADLVASRKIPLATTLQIGDSFTRIAEHPEYLDEPLYRECIEPEEREYLRSVDAP